MPYFHGWTIEQEKELLGRSRGARTADAAPVKTYEDLIGAPFESDDDDGAVILHDGDLSPVCGDCRRGHLRWAEGGYVPGQRICDVCGSHWDLHPITWGVTRLDDGTLARWIDGRGYVPLNANERIGESGKTWGHFFALITPEMWAAASEPSRVLQMANSVTVSGAWAQRARFYR